ncbi:lysylphosphatidylglycerol synthase transmembrane domain-containing protein [Desulfococcaceae bacterium HSG9]|nr:lysylphosphatidylglycerol synthase transmembrane domain-containing protein [Desulfococcaceae bacterium HSG9]
MKLHNIKTIIIKVALSATFFFILFESIPGAKFRIRLNQIDLFFLTLSLLVIPAVIFTNCLKWKILVEQQGQPVNFFYLLRIYFIGYFFSNLLPSNVGGDVVRALYLGRHIKDKSLAAVSVFIERLSGIFLLMVLTVVAPLMKPSLYHHIYIILPAIGAFIFIILINRMGKMRNPLKVPRRLARHIFLPVHKHNNIKHGNFIINVFKKLEHYGEKAFLKTDAFHKKLMQALTYLKNDKLLLGRVVMLTFFFYGMTWVNIYVSFRAFGVRPDFIAISAVTPVAMLVAMVPVTMLGNLGFTEGVYVVFFSLIGMDYSASLAMSMLLRLKMLLMGSVGMIFYLMHRRR